MKVMASEIDVLRRKNSHLQDMIRISADKGPTKPRQNLSNRVVNRGKKARKKSPTQRRKVNTPASGALEAAEAGNRDLQELDSILQTLGKRVQNSEMLQHDEDLHELRQQLRESRAQVVQLQHAFDGVETGLNAAKRVQQAALERAEASTREARIQADTLRAQRERIVALERSEAQLASMNVVVDDLRATNKSLQQQVETLTKSAFAADSAESERVRRALATHTKERNELQETLAMREAKIDRLEDELRRVQGSRQNQTQESESLREEIAGLKAQLAGEGGRVRELNARMSAFSAASGVELEELEHALELVRRSNGDSIVAGGGNESVNLRERVEKLELSNKELVVQLRAKDDIIRVQTQLRVESEKKRIALKDAHARLKKEHREILRVMAQRPRAESVVSELSLMSQMSVTSLHGNSNLVVMRVVGAAFDGSTMDEQDLKDSFTFIGIDFFEFETCYSGVFAGQKPRYGLTAQYQLEVDALFVQYLRERQATIDVFRQDRGGEVERIGRAKVPLSALLEYSAKLKRTVEIRSMSNRDHKIGRIEVVLKMYRALVSNAPSEVGENEDSAELGDFLMRMNVRLNSLRVDDEMLDVSTIQSHVRNQHYKLDSDVERVSQFDSTADPDTTNGVFVHAFEFHSNRERLKTDEIIVMDVLDDNETDNLVGRIGIPLELVAASSSGKLVDNFDVRNRVNNISGRANLTLEWILIRAPDS